MRTVPAALAWHAWQLAFGAAARGATRTPSTSAIAAAHAPGPARRRFACVTWPRGSMRWRMAGGGESRALRRYWSQRGAMALQIGLGVVALAVLKLEASRPRYKKEVKGAYSVPESAAPGAPFRRADMLGELKTVPFPGCDTIYSTFQYAARNNGRRNAVGTRKIIKVRPSCAAPAAARCLVRLWHLLRHARGDYEALCGPAFRTAPLSQNSGSPRVCCLDARRGAIGRIAAPQPLQLRQLHPPRTFYSALRFRAAHATSAGGACD